jgi:hypothetical protein
VGNTQLPQGIQIHDPQTPGCLHNLILDFADARRILPATSTHHVIKTPPVYRYRYRHSAFALAQTEGACVTVLHAYPVHQMHFTAVSLSQHRTLQILRLLPAPYCSNGRQVWYSGARQTHCLRHLCSRFIHHCFASASRYLRNSIPRTYTKSHPNRTFSHWHHG